jgi:predicted ester cyclase
MSHRRRAQRRVPERSDVTIGGNKGVGQRLVDSVNARQLDAISEVVASDVVDHNAVIFMQPEGAGGVDEGIRMLLTGFPDLRITVHELIEEDDKVVARLTLSGTNLGEYRGLPRPTNRYFENEAIAIFTIKDEKAVEIRGTADRLGMLTQLGILPDIG